jgi:hypothetical protein
VLTIFNILSWSVNFFHLLCGYLERTLWSTWYIQV